MKFQDEDKRFINIYHFGIEPMGFQTPLTQELLLKIIINPDCCEGKYPHVNVVNVHDPGSHNCAVFMLYTCIILLQT